MRFQNKHCVSYKPQWWQREEPAIKPIIKKEKYLLVKIAFHRYNEWVVGLLSCTYTVQQWIPMD